MERITFTDYRKVRRFWESNGGTVRKIRRTGEEFWEHPAFQKPVRVNCRRKDIPAIIFSRTNKINKK